MVNNARPTTTGPTYVKVANFPGLYRHARNGRYYACKKLGGIHRESSLGTCDPKIPERNLKGWRRTRSACRSLEPAIGIGCARPGMLRNIGSLPRVSVE